MTQKLFDQVGFAKNPEPRCPVVLVLDTSQSMEGTSIRELNEGLRTFSKTLREDRKASLRVEAAIITFGGKVQVVDVRDGEAQPIPFDAERAFVTMDNFQPPTLTVRGHTPMGEAVSWALKLLRERKEIYRQNAISYFRPWIFLITDGEPTNEEGYPTDDWRPAAQEVKDEKARKGVIFYAVGVEEANMEVLAEFSGEDPVCKLKRLDFERLFLWLSNSMSAVARQAPVPPIDCGEDDV